MWEKQAEKLVIRLNWTLIESYILAPVRVILDISTQIAIR